MNNYINKKIGESFEEYLRELLKINNIWSIKLKEKENGAPFDIIASKNNIFFGIEAKHIKKGKTFPLSRVETNQKMSIKKLEELNTTNTWFFFYCNNDIGKFNNFNESNIHIIPGNGIINSKEKSINVVENGITFKEWLLKNK